MKRQVEVPKRGRGRPPKPPVGVAPKSEGDGVDPILVLEAIASDPLAPPTARVAAARALLEARRKDQPTPPDGLIVWKRGLGDA
jgi:hypothetical protein